MLMNTEAQNNSRHQAIVELVNQRGYMLVEDLCDLLGVSKATMRTDLDTLDGQNLLIRLRGVALSLRYSSEERQHGFSGDNSAAFLIHKMSEEKKKIARECMKMLRPNDTVFLDTSNTNLTLAAMMVAATHLPLTVVTNSLDILQALRHGAHISTVITGGDYEAATNSLVGSLAVRFLEGFQANYAFVTARGFNPKSGVRVYHSQNTMIRLAMLGNAENRVILADHSKFTLVGVEVLCGWDRVDTLVTDLPPPTEYEQPFARYGVRVVLPEPGEMETHMEG